MKKLIKRIKCPECGAEFKGFWINPICTCGHQLRDLTSTEAAWSNIDEYDTVQDKRDSVRNSEWGFVDIKWRSIMDLTFILFDAVFIFKILPYLFPTKSTLDLVMLIGAIVMGASVILHWIYGLIKTRYFEYLENKDDEYFAAQGEQ